jgi:hypothetical protein
MIKIKKAKKRKKELMPNPKSFQKALKRII